MLEVKLYKIVIGELTSPWEENFKLADSHKLNKYTDLSSSLANKGFKVSLFCFSIGARGFVGSSFETFLVKLGMQKRAMRIAIAKAANVSNYCSYIIFKRKDIVNWIDFGCVTTGLG